jgi:PKD repeat protein
MQTSNNVIAFTDASTNVPALTNYQWDFGDVTYSYVQNPVHTYSIPGTYNVCLTILDSNFASSCSSTFCSNVTVTGNVICTMTLSFFSVTMPSCSTCADGSVSAAPNGGTPPYTYSWSPVSATSQTANNLLPGTYTCCITDANACTACDTITISSSTCQAAFTWTQPSNNVINFTNTSTGTTVNTGYWWDFGDGNYSSTAIPTHTYNNAGDYTVCLQISDSNFTGSCFSTWCDSVHVTGVNCNNLSLSVTTVGASCPTCSDGSASAAGSGGTPPYSYLWSNNATSQSISNLSQGYYTCCITDALGCTACDGGIVDSMIICSAYFTLTAAVTPHTYTATNFASGVQPLSYNWSWGDATYSYIANPTHTYAAAGWYAICLTITDAALCTSTYCDSFNLQRFDASNTMVTVNVVPPSASGIPNPNLSPETIFIYPNPVTNQLSIVGYLLEMNRIEIYDVLGDKVISERLSISGYQYIMNVSDLNRGIYFVTVKGDKAEWAAKFEKQ